MNQKVEGKNTNLNDYQLVTKIILNFNPNGLFQLNDYIIALYNYKLIKFYSKNDFHFMFQIEEYLFKDIKFCKKYKKDSIIVYAGDFLYFVLIVENREYRILNYLKITADYYAFNSSLDFLAFRRIKKKNHYMILNII